MECEYNAKKLEYNTKKFCHHCICKTCLLAEVNGGAPGCGDCYKCLNEEYSLFCQSCSDYYNCNPARGMNLDYFHQKAVENGKMKPEEEVVFSEEELKKVVEELTKSIKEYRKEFLEENE
jgi:hypothetical protein